MSQKVATLNYDTRFSRIFRRDRNSASLCRNCQASLSTENVLSSVRTSDEMLDKDNHEVRDDAVYVQREASRHREKVLQQQINGHSTNTVEDIEKWLKNSNDSVSITEISMKNNPQASMEKYFSDQLPEAFFEKDPLTADIDLVTKKLNTSYDTIFTESPNEKFLSISDKDDVFILPDFPLDGLDQLACYADDLILANEILPSTNVQPPYNNINTKDLNIRLQETINRLSDNGKIVDNVQIENDNHQFNNAFHFENGDNDDNSLTSFENVAHNKLNVGHHNHHVPKGTQNNDTPELEHSILQPLQTKSKHSHVKSRNVNSINTSSTSAKPRFQPSIIKRKRKLLTEESTHCINKDNVMSVVAVSLDKPSNVTHTQIIINTNTNYEPSEDRSLRCNKKTRKKSINSNTSESEQEDNIAVRPFSYYNQQELVISKALEEVGVTDNMLQHVTAGDHVRVWQCHQDECSRQFAKLCSLKAHLLTHFGIRPFKCDYEGCSWAFYSDFKLKRHKETHLKKKDYICSMPGCKRRFTTIYNLASHEKLHTRPNRIVCQVPECTAKFQTKRALEIHMKTHDESLAPYVCNFEGCGKRYYGSNALMSHQRCHSYSELDLTCSWPGCGKTFDQPCRLKAHMRSHTGCKPYACTFKGCKWAFSTSSKLKRHQKKHTNDRKFVCDIGDCNKAFMRSEHLKEHLLTHTEGRCFQCHLCGSSFTAKSSLYVHIKKHSNKEFVSKAHRQPRKKTVEKKTVNKKKEVVYCSRVQPVRIPSNRLKMKSLTADCQKTEEVNSYEQDNVSVEEDIKPVVFTPNEICPTTEDKTAKNSYVCPAESCTKSYRTKARLKMHLQKEHVPPPVKIEQSNVQHVVSSSLLSQKDLVYDTTRCSSNKPTDQIIIAAIESISNYLDDQNVTSTIQNCAILKTESDTSDIQPNSMHLDVVDESIVGNQGTARTALTLRQVLKMKPNRGIVDSGVCASDVVLTTANFSDGLLLSDDLPSIYCQEDIEVPGYQIMLLDTDPTEAEISMQHLD